MESIKNFNYEELMLKLGVYQSVEIDLQWGDEKTWEPIEELRENEYYTETSEDFQKLIKFISKPSTEVISGFCPVCKSKTHFSIGIGKKLENKFLSGRIRTYTDSQIDGDWYVPELDEAMDKLCNTLVDFGKAKFFDKHFSCVKCKETYKVSFLLEYKKDTNKLILTKIGQYPRLSIIRGDENKSFDKILKKFDAVRDYQNATRNHVDGDNIASFVYLRRIVEKYIKYTFEKNIKMVNISEDEFSKKTTEEKISCLKKVLSDKNIPEILSQNKKLYSVMSKGIHELKENECAKMYDSIKNIIDSILEIELSKVKHKKITNSFQKELMEFQNNNK